MFEREDRKRAKEELLQPFLLVKLLFLILLVEIILLPGVAERVAVQRLREYYI